MSSIYIDKKLIFNIIKKEFYSSQPKDYDSEESLLAPWMEEPGELQSMGSQRLRHG